MKDVRPWIPWPREAVPDGGPPCALTGRSRVAVSDPALLSLARIVADDVAAIGGPVRLESVVGEPRAGDIALCLAPGDPDSYRLEVGEHVSVTGRDDLALALGVSTLIQAAASGDGTQCVVPRCVVEDSSAAGYRGVMVDCARHPIAMGTLRRIVEACRFYKVRYLHLHLTDDEAFTFPSRCLPEIVTPGRGYTRDQLCDLERFARARGVVLVPELDVPGHSAALVAAKPDLFGLRDRARNPSLLHMGREAVYAALDRLVGEMCEVFASSPWFHIGGDEVELGGVDHDAEARAYMAAHGLSSGSDLYRHFLLTMHEAVRRRGRRTIVWEGFRRDGRVELPRDIVVMAWDTGYYRPDQLIEDGYSVINASWQPLYIVGGDGPAARMWSQDDVYRWHPGRFEHHDRRAPSFGGLDIGESHALLGAQMCVWEHPEAELVGHLRPRLAAFAERLWRGSAAPPGAELAARYRGADLRLTQLLRE